MQIEEGNWYEVSGLVLRYDQNVLNDSLCNKLQNGLLYYCQPFHNPTSVQCLGLDCEVEYTIANQGIMPEAHNIWIQYTGSEENNLDNTFQGWIPGFPGLYFSWTLLNQIHQVQMRLLAGKTSSIFSKKCKKTQQWVLHPQAQDYKVVIPTSTTIFVVGLIVLTGSSWLSNKRNRCILYTLEP